jgi:hypothetical protein
MCVFATDDLGDLALLSSSAHQNWAITYGSTLETRVRYTPSDVFETYPRPSSVSSLKATGQALHERRNEIMRRRSLNLTQLYNQVNNPAVTSESDLDISLMRALHVKVDTAVMGTYGWTDIVLDHGFHTYRQMERWTVSPLARVEILDRLLEENHRRAERDIVPGPLERRNRPGKSVSNVEGTLFE